MNPADMTPRGLMLDWGGVLTTSPFESFARFAQAEGLPEDAVRIAARRGGALHEPFVRLERGEISDTEFSRAATACLGLPARRADGLLRRLFAGLRRNDQLCSAVHALRQRGVRTALLSNSSGQGGYDDPVVAELFDVVVISRDVGLRKPDPAIYALAVRRLQIPPRQLVFVDDLKANLRPAADLGIVTVLHRETEATLARLQHLFGAPTSVSALNRPVPSAGAGLER